MNRTTSTRRAIKGLVLVVSAYCLLWLVCYLASALMWVALSVDDSYSVVLDAHDPGSIGFIYHTMAGSSSVNKTRRYFPLPFSYFEPTSDTRAVLLRLEIGRDRLAKLPELNANARIVIHVVTFGEDGGQLSTTASSYSADDITVEVGEYQSVFYFDWIDVPDVSNSHRIVLEVYLQSDGNVPPNGDMVGTRLATLVLLHSTHLKLRWGVV